MKKTSGDAKKSEPVEKESLKREDLVAYLNDISQKVLETDSSTMHSMIALDQILRLPNIDKLLDDELKAQAKDLWTKLKLSGLNINDAPILFGEEASTEKAARE